MVVVSIIPRRQNCCEFCYTKMWHFRAWSRNTESDASTAEFKEWAKLHDFHSIEYMERVHSLFYATRSAPVVNGTQQQLLFWIFPEVYVKFLVCCFILLFMLAPIVVYCPKLFEIFLSMTGFDAISVDVLNHYFNALIQKY